MLAEEREDGFNRVKLYHCISKECQLFTTGLLQAILEESLSPSTHTILNDSTQTLAAPFAYIKLKGRRGD
jgi:hypothetical protein